MTNPPQHKRAGPVVNRIADIMLHTKRYSFKGVLRLAEDSGIHPASVSRIIHSRRYPTGLSLLRITNALEKALGFPLDPRDVVTDTGHFLHDSCCAACRCPGCLPPAAWDRFGNRTPAFANVPPGHWVSSEFPYGLTNTPNQEKP